MNSNLKEISTFIKKNNSYSDFNLVDNFLLNLNFTKIDFNKKKNLIGGKEVEELYPNQGPLPSYEETILNQGQLPQYSYQGQQPSYEEAILNQGPLPQYSYQEQQPSYREAILNQGQDFQFQDQQNNINKLPDIYLKNPPFTTDKVETYTIKEGTILYHATSNKKGFNTNYINLGQDKLINFFTPNFRLASDKIEGCSVDKQNGYIHVFKVIKDIPNIYVKLPFDIADDINSGLLANEFCSSNQTYYGIGFFYPKNNIEMFSNNPYQYGQQLNLNDEDMYSEFGLCNPKPYLQYLYTQKCQSLRKLSEPYRFN
jgi:hypothetical protein